MDFKVRGSFTVLSVFWFALQVLEGELMADSTKKAEVFASQSWANYSDQLRFRN